MSDYLAQGRALRRLLVCIDHQKRLTIVKKSISAVLALAISGCAVGLNYKKPATTAPAQFGEASPTTQPVHRLNVTHYWKTFNDPELTSLVDRAVLNNNSYLQAQARVRQARAQLGVEIGTEFPTLSANLGTSRSQVSRNLSSAAAVSGSGSTGVAGTTTGGTGTTGGSGTTGTGASSTVTSVSNGAGLPSRRANLFQGGFDAGWEIDVFGGNRRAIESAADDLEAQIDARRNTLVTLTAEVARDYVLLRGYQAQLKLTQSNAKSESDTLDLTKSRFNAGLVSDLDVAQAQASVATTVAQEPTLEISIKQSIHAISILLGEEPMALNAELSTDQPIPPVPTDIPVGIPSELLRRRPDVRQAERTLAETTANIGVAVAQLFPKFSLTGSLGQESSRLGLIARDSSSVWSIGPTVSWQLLDYYQLQSQVRVSNAEQVQAMYAYRQTVLQSFSDVEDALVAYSQDQIRTKAINDEAAANQRAVDLSLQLYQRGLGDFLNVLTAERSLYSSQSDLSVSQSNVASDLVQLYKAMGGGWDEQDEERFNKFEDPKIPVAMK